MMIWLNHNNNSALEVWSITSKFFIIHRADGGLLRNQAVQMASDKEVYQLVLELTASEQRESGLLELSKKRESVPDLAPILWHSFGTISALLQEIVHIYPLLSPPALTAHASNRVCNALALLQCVASHVETRTLFLNAHIPLFLYPFLNTVSKTKPFEYLRLTSLGVIGDWAAPAHAFAYVLPRRKRGVKGT